MESLENPTAWEAGTGVHKNRWKCLACKDNIWRELRHASRHETGKSHQEAAAFMISEAAQISASQSGHHRDLVSGPLSELLWDLHSESPPSPPPDDAASSQYHHLDWDAIFDDTDTQFALPTDDAAIRRMAGSLSDWLAAAPHELGPSRSDSEASVDEEQAAAAVEAEEQDSLRTGAQRIRQHKDAPMDSAWFPWPDKAACILDILRHLPRSLFSDSQMEIIRWGLAMFGIDNIPSVSWMKELDSDLQRIYGIRTLRHTGALGHIYYTNSLSDIIAQEMANPRVRPYLHHFPEDAGSQLEEAWQAERWLHEMDESLLSPMIRIGTEDFFVHEPAKLNDGRICMPMRFFTSGRTRGSPTAPEYYAKVCRLEPVITEAGPRGYVVHEYDSFNVPVRELSLSFPQLKETHESDSLPDPRKIIGMITSRGRGVCPWTRTNPNHGNRWRTLAKGHRVVAFMMWLYCDDTSGNLSKKWNKHNSFLFTPAGLPREMAQKESNVHFLATSNIAPPLEMLDGIVTELEDGQLYGIWAWDCVSKEMVLVIPGVLAFLGDNPMQSEIACHIGLRGKFFCRCCWVKGKDAEDQEHAPEPSGSRNNSDNFSACRINKMRASNLENKTILFWLSNTSLYT
ncbi:hypothetical protein FA95DRAFT_912230 [Auriscalpium vulgare]|uniref:Uncharacterized protein n=1 Tax=Auriscalpium vulgare TaxID=40419 RepID=A0ACB8R9E5_9AGAM|nr:hypothetical protein FA95DRAFT_912230 [Auriscalpium vulgare]